MKHTAEGLGGVAAGEKSADDTNAPIASMNGSTVVTNSLRKDVLSTDVPAGSPTAKNTAERASQPVVSVTDLRVWYAGASGPVRAVDGVSFSLAPGEVLGLVGESGCGKSTLGRGLLGLLPSSAAIDGKFDFDGEDLLAGTRAAWNKQRGSGLGMIFQEPMTRLDPLMRISDHFREAIRVHEKISKKDADLRALETLRALGIPPSRYKNYPHEFSGGMRQRIMIALALALRPKFVVADEPTTALDVLVEAQIVRILAEMKISFAPAMLLITHNLGIVAEACDKVAVMYAGRIVEEGPVEQVFSRPQHPYTRELLKSTISLETTELNSIPGAPPDLSDPPTGCYFHPRCPDAMQVCGQSSPPEVTAANGSRSVCWLGSLESVSAAGRAPLQRQELSVADEA